MGITENLLRVKERIAEAAMAAGRDPAEVTLVAVSKNRGPDEIREAARAGQKVFGENRAQELRWKLEELEDEDIEWHFIGHLQRNKVNMVVGRVVLVHSVDSLALAEAVNARARSLDVVQEALLQVNVSGEETKYGVAPQDVEALLDRLLDMENLAVRGLMTMAPLQAAGEMARPYFRRLREIRDCLRERYPQARLDVLSMGMSQDFEVAVEEGANLVRVGTAIFSGT